jgi:hypothetical protein
MIYQLDADLKGWVVIVFSHDGAAPLTKVGDDAYLVTVPRSGVLMTSTQMEAGRATDRFIVRNPNRTETPMPATRLRANQTGWERKGDGKPMEYEVFFVGSEDELRAAEPSERVVSRVYESLTSKR